MNIIDWTLNCERKRKKAVIKNLFAPSDISMDLLIHSEPRSDPQILSLFYQTSVG